MQKQFGQDYLRAIDDLFSTYESREKFPSGILPSFCKEKYSEAQEIRTLISQENSNTKIEGLEHIINKKNAKNFVDEIKDHPYNTGRHIAKTSIRGESYLHTACVKEVGHEGHFRRKGFGYNGRVLFEVEKENNQYKVTVFKYLKDHSEYNKFFQK